MNEETAMMLLEAIDEITIEVAAIRVEYAAMTSPDNDGEEE